MSTRMLRESRSATMDRLLEKVRDPRARYLEIRYERVQGSNVAYRGRNLRSCANRSEASGMVRALCEGGWGTATFSDLSRLEWAVERAIEAARFLSGERVELADVEPVDVDHEAPAADELLGATLEERRRLVEEYNRQMLAVSDTIADTIASIADRVDETLLVTSEGTRIRRRSTILDLRLSAIARRNHDIQMGHGVDGFRDAGLDVARHRDQWVERATADALANLAAPPVAGGTYTVVCDPRMTGLFTHEAFGHLSEADHQAANPQLREQMRLGRVFGQPILNLFDSGDESPSLLGTVPIDDEGVPTRRTDLIREGRLVGRLHSRETAARMGEAPTGNARAQSAGCTPIVRMRNTAIAPGSSSFDELIAGVDDGLYVVGGGGGQTRLGNFSFSASHAFRIVKGRLGERVRDVLLSGNIFQTLADIDAVGNDPEWSCAGRCGKQGQSMPVGLGGPHVRIRNVIVGGT